MVASRDDMAPVWMFTSKIFLLYNSCNVVDVMNYIVFALTTVSDER